MKISKDAVVQSDSLGDRGARRKSDDSTEDKQGERHTKGDDASEPLRVSIDQLLSANGRIKLEGSLIFEAPQKPSPVAPKLHLISTEMAFHFHKLAEMQLITTPSNQNLAPNERNNVSQIIKNYQYPQKAIQNRSIAERASVI